MAFTRIQNAQDATALAGFTLTASGGLIALATAIGASLLGEPTTLLLVTLASGLLLAASGLLAWANTRFLAGLTGVLGGLLAAPAAAAAAMLGIPGAVLTLIALHMEREAEKPAELPREIRPEARRSTGA